MSEEEKDIFYLIIIGTTLFVTILLFLFFGILAHNKRKTAYNENLLKLQSQFSETLLRAQLEIKEEALSYVSTELHDNVGQSISLMKIYLNSVDLEDKQMASVKLEESKALLRQLITDVKSLSVSLGGERLLKSGLSNAIAFEIGRINKTRVFNAEFTEAGESFVIDSEKTLILYRMVQESLNNTLKHSRADKINVNLLWSDHLLELQIQDNGAGFDVVQNWGDGAGLTNLRKRADLICADLVITSEIEKGTNVAIKLNYK